MSWCTYGSFHQQGVLLRTEDATHSSWEASAGLGSIGRKRKHWCIGWRSKCDANGGCCWMIVRWVLPNPEDGRSGLCMCARCFVLCAPSEYALINFRIVAWQKLLPSTYCGIAHHYIYRVYRHRHHHRRHLCRRCRRKSSISKCSTLKIFRKKNHWKSSLLSSQKWLLLSACVFSARSALCETRTRREKVFK